MPTVVYTGDTEVTVAIGNGIDVAPGDTLEVDDVTAGGLVGYGTGVWQYADSVPVEIVDGPTTSEEND
jgi:hypothetical protein